MSVNTAYELFNELATKLSERASLNTEGKQRASSEKILEQPVIVLLKSLIDSTDFPDKFKVITVREKPKKLDMDLLLNRFPMYHTVIQKLGFDVLFENATRLDLEVYNEDKLVLAIELKTYIDNTMYARYVTARAFNRLTSMLSGHNINTALIAGQSAASIPFDKTDFVMNPIKRISKMHFDCLHYKPLIDKEAFTLLFDYLNSIFDEYINKTTTNE